MLGILTARIELFSKAEVPATTGAEYPIEMPAGSCPNLGPLYPSERSACDYENRD